MLFFILSKILDFLLAPLTWILILFTWALFARNQVRKRRLIISSFVLLVIFTNPFLANKMMGWWETRPYPMDKLDGTYDVAILLGGSLRYYSTESMRPVYSQSVDRLLQTISLYKSGKVKKILLSGGSGLVMNQVDKESDILIGVLRQAGIPDEDIIIERTSRNTYENAAFSAKVLKKHGIRGRNLLVTSAFHMPRSIACFRKAGLEVKGFPVDEKTGTLPLTPDTTILPDANCLVTWDSLFHEWFGILIYRLAGYI